MTPLQKNALGTRVLAASEVEAIYKLLDPLDTALIDLCRSHERLRVELAEAEKLLKPFADWWKEWGCPAAEITRSNYLKAAAFISRHAASPANKRKDGSE